MQEVQKIHEFLRLTDNTELQRWSMSLKSIGEFLEFLKIILKYIVTTEIHTETESHPLPSSLHKNK